LILFSVHIRILAFWWSLLKLDTCYWVIGYRCVSRVELEYTRDKCAAAVHEIYTVHSSICNWMIRAVSGNTSIG